MKYLKTFKSPHFTGPLFREEISYFTGQPKHGPTIMYFENTKTHETKIAYTGKDIYKENESPIQYTWKYEYYNGHPAIIVNFSRIDSGYANNIICLESNNMDRGIGSQYYNPKHLNLSLSGENNNTALNVLKKEPFELNTETKNVTWYKLGDLELNKDYPIYITVTGRYNKRAASIIAVKKMSKNDYETRINIRPTIRGSFNLTHSTINNTCIFRHTPHIPAKEYMSVKFPYIDIFQV